MAYLFMGIIVLFLIGIIVVGMTMDKEDLEQ
jgi:hypothetical protein